MTGWIPALIAAALVAIGLIWWMRPGRVVLALVIGSLMLGLAGYALQGQPSLAGSATPARERAMRDDSSFATERYKLLEDVGNVGAWLNFADALQRAGMTRYSVEAMGQATRAFPQSPDLWVGLGNALVIHGEGRVTPAAELAFGHAQALAPEHPGPPFFFGLAWMQAGRPEEALRVWQRLRDDSLEGAPWLPELDQRIALARAAVGAAGTSMPAAPNTPPKN